MSMKILDNADKKNPPESAYSWAFAFSLWEEPIWASHCQTQYM